MKKTLTWLGVAVGLFVVFFGAGVGGSLGNKESLSTHMISKKTGKKDGSSKRSYTTSSSF